MIWLANPPLTKALFEHQTRRRVGLSWAAALLSVAAAVLIGSWALSDHRTWSLVENTLLLVAGTLAISLPAGTALAVLLFRTDAPARRTVVVLLGIMLVVPLYLQAAAWEAGFGPSGWFTALTGNPYELPWLSGWWVQCGSSALAAIPWIVLIVGVAVRWVEPELEEATLLDASGWQVLLRVTLRTRAPGDRSGCGMDRAGRGYRNDGVRSVSDRHDAAADLCRGDLHRVRAGATSSPTAARRAEECKR